MVDKQDQVVNETVKQDNQGEKKELDDNPQTCVNQASKKKHPNYSVLCSGDECVEETVY